MAPRVLSPRFRADSSQKRCGRRSALGTPGTPGTRESEIELHVQLDEPREQNFVRLLPCAKGVVERHRGASVKRVVDVDSHVRTVSAVPQDLRDAKVELVDP